MALLVVTAMVSSAGSDAARAAGPPEPPRLFVDGTYAPLLAKGLLLALVTLECRDDSFGAFPKTEFAADQPDRDKFVCAAGEQSIGVDQMREVLNH